MPVRTSGQSQVDISQVYKATSLLIFIFIFVYLRFNFAPFENVTFDTECFPLYETIFYYVQVLILSCH